MNTQKIVDFFYCITGLDICIYNEKKELISQTISFSFPKQVQSAFEKEKQDLLPYLDALKPKEYFQTTLPSFYLHFLLLNLDNNLYAMIGPFVYKDFPSDAILQIMRTFSIPSSLHPEYSKIFQRIPVNYRPLPITGDLILTLFQNDIANGTFINPPDTPANIKNYSRASAEAKTFLLDPLSPLSFPYCFLPVQLMTYLITLSSVFYSRY